MATGTDDAVVVHRDEVVALCLAALDAVGARRRVAELLTDAALFAEDRGKAVVGVAHLLDHVDAMADGRLDGRAVPLIGHPSPAVTTSDARGGIAQTGFDGSFPGLVQAAHEYGLAAFAQQGAFTCGPLGWFTERLADAGLVAVATAVAPAVLAAGPGTGRVFGTNPMAYSVPRAGRAPLTVDQASSSTAFVSVRDAAAQGTPLPEGWAVDADGRPTTDPEAALAGALLPFGGTRARTSPCSSSSCPRWRAATGRWTRRRGTRVHGRRRSGCSSSRSTTAPSAAGSGARRGAPRPPGRLRGASGRRPPDRGSSRSRADPLTLRADVVAALRRRAGPAPSARSRASRHPRSELITASPRAASRSARRSTRSWRRPRSSRRARSTPGRHPDASGGVHQVPSTFSASVARRDLRELPACVDHDDVVDVGPPQTATVVRLPEGRLVVEPPLERVDRFVVDREGDGLRRSRGERFHVDGHRSGAPQPQPDTRRVATGEPRPQSLHRAGMSNRNPRCSADSARRRR